MVDARPRVVFVADGQEVTHRQLEALIALDERGSMKRAAESLGVSTPVLHKHVREAEDKAGVALVSSTSRGTSLTVDGIELVRRFKAYELRLRDDTRLRIAATMVSERCVLRAASALSDKGVPCRVVIATDESNMRLVDEMRVDCVLLDDPFFAMERAPERSSVEVASDLLLHRDIGEKYVRLAFGAQRLGFRFLEGRKAKYRITREVYDPCLLDRSGLSYFVNRSLVRRGLVEAEGAREQGWSVHCIMGVLCSEHEHLEAFIAEARRAGL